MRKFFRFMAPLATLAVFTATVKSFGVISPIATVLAFVILVSALSISASTTVKDMINLYQWQAWVLAAVVLLAASEADEFNLTLAFLTLVPALLAVSIKPLLGRATLTQPGALSAQSLEVLVSRRVGTRSTLIDKFYSFWSDLLDAPRRANLIWLQQGHSQRSGLVSIGIDLTLTIAAFLVAYRLVRSPQGTTQLGHIDPNSLAVSLALLLLGVFIMTNKEDIIAQIMGLLVMEHGMFLAAIKIITVLALTPVFVLSLILYLLITLLILLWLLPNLHQVSKGILLNEQRTLKG